MVWIKAIVRLGDMDDYPEWAFFNVGTKMM